MARSRLRLVCLISDLGMLGGGRINSLEVVLLRCQQRFAMSDAQTLYTEDSVRNLTSCNSMESQIGLEVSLIRRSQAHGKGSLP